MTEQSAPILSTWVAWSVVFGLGFAAALGLALIRLLRWAMPRPEAPADSAERMLPLLVLLPFAGLVLWIFSPSAPPVLPPPRPVEMAPMSPRALAAFAADSGVAAGAAAGHRLISKRSAATLDDIPPPPLDPGMRPGTIVTEPVLSPAPSARREQALQSALELAREKLIESLGAAGVPAHRVPPLPQIEREYLRPGLAQDVLPTPAIQKEWAEAGLEPNRQWVRVTLAVSPDQLRELRAEGRAVAGLAGVGAVCVALGLLWSFVRLDAWTKGYLTTALGTGAALLAVGFAGGAWWLLRHGVVP